MYARMIRPGRQLSAALLAAALAASGAAFAQSSAGNNKGGASSASTGSAATGSAGATMSPSGKSSQSSQTRADTQPPGASAVAPSMGIGGITPGRAELASSAFSKLDARNRGYVTMEDVSQLDGFGTQFKQADRDNDGRLNAAEFDTAWAAFGIGVR